MSGIRVFQSLWAMQPHGPDGVKVPVGDAFDMVADAGFDGMAIDLGVADMAAALACRPHFERTGLTPLIVAFPRSVEALRPVLRMAKDFGSPFVVVIGQVWALTLEGMIPVIRDWIAMSEEEAMPVQFETHRNCITNDLFTTLQLIDAIPEMRLAADLSHFLVDREFRHPLSDFEQGLIHRILIRSDSFQGRVASREQVQIPLGFPQNRKWVDQFEAWWEQGFRLWRDRNPADEDVVFLCELGPPEYAITGADGRELSDRWDEARQIRDTVRSIWARLEWEGG